MLSWSLTYRQQTVGLLSFHNRACRFFTIDHRHTHTYYGFCFPEEPWLTCLSFNSLPAWPSLTAALLQHHGSLSLPASALSFLHPCLCLVGFPGDANGKEHACQCRRHRFDPWVRMIPWRRAWQPTPVILPGNFHGQRSLSGYSPRGHKEMDRTEQLSTHIRTHHIFSFYCSNKNSQRAMWPEAKNHVRQPFFHAATTCVFWHNLISISSLCLCHGLSHTEIKRCLLFRRKGMTNLDSVLKSRYITLPTKVCIV